MTTMDKGGLRCYLNEENKMVKVDIYEYTETERAILEQNANDIKEIFYGSYLCDVDFSMIAKMKNLEMLNIDDRYKVVDISFANGLKNLKGLATGKFTGTLNNKNLVALSYKWHKKSDISQSTNIEGLGITNCADMEVFLSQVKELKKLERMMIWKISSQSFPKTDTVTHVTWLEFFFCPRLMDIKELPSIFPKLKHLSCDHCKNIQDYSPLAKLTDLEELIIHESAPVADLSFLKEMKKLTLLKIFKTKITAKNVEILDGISAKLDLFSTGIN
ncbi:leucine-rich repeat domain-containing protein [Treponema zioleckii]|uniref:leucine-rich repeat domain-containing protein n=1 Tax=Treponema zioleckii TaxID=331680 RepID=UPI00168BF548|nr:leucine-rich repeat domain-containing protein [Treponema zioleckii]